MLPNPLGQTVEPEMDLLTNSAMIVREGIPNYHADKDIHVLASLFETMPDSPMSKFLTSDPAKWFSTRSMA